jgi:hypothetical protein
MLYRKSKIAVLVLLSFTIADVSAQHKWNMTFKAYPSLTWLHINSSSPAYNKRWENVNLSYPSKGGFGLGFGLEYAISDKVRVFTDLRYNSWGGNIYAIRNDPTFYLDLDINYRSLNLPFGIKYCYKVKPAYNLYLSAGAGLDYTYHVSFIPTNYYGSVPTIERNASMQIYYVLVGTGIEFKISNKLTGVMGLEFDNDRLLNPNRIQDFGGLFGQEEIPLSYSMVLFHLGVKI